MIFEKQTIRLRQMEFYAQHGVLPQERVVGGRYVVDITLEVRMDEAALLHDCLEGTVNYAEVYEVVREEMDVPSKLLEHVATRILKAVMKNFSLVQRASVNVCKVNPPMRAVCQGASVELTTVRDEKSGSVVM